MIFRSPRAQDVFRLRTLWKEAFGDTDAFMDAFYGTAYSPERCRVALDGDRIVGMAYWFDGVCRGQKVAYLYGIATAKSHRGMGIAHGLMECVHDLLRSEGYAGTVLVPAQGLSSLYEGVGYRFFGGVDTVSCRAGAEITAERIDGARYEQLRRAALPAGGVEQPGASVAFLEKQAGFYAGEGFLLAARLEGDTLVGLELLGDAAAAPGLVTALGAKEGRFRVPGQQPFAMFRPLQPGAQAPAYFGLAFD